MSFEKFPHIDNRTKDELRKHGITGLFPIQAKTFDYIYNGEDLIARDLTGSGKTMAFALPIVERMRKNKSFDSPDKNRVIILTPTRELATQVQQEIEKLKHFRSEFKVTCIYGGVPYDRQERDLLQGSDIIVGTTGRFMDHMRRIKFNLKNVEAVILDEADRMLDMGFAPDINEIMNKVKYDSEKKPQFVLFSATIPTWVKQVARTYLNKEHQFVDLVKNLKNKTAKSVVHMSIPCEDENKINALADVMKSHYEPDIKIIVFTETKMEANDILNSKALKSIGSGSGRVGVQ
jgi:ATP-dependent RNA helicase DDX21